MSQNLSVKKFEWIRDTFNLNKYHKKAITKKVMKDIFSKLMFSILKNYRFSW